MSARLLVLGAGGQLARALASAGAAAGYETVCAGRDQADLAERGAVGRLIDTVRPDLVINAAAYTAVDDAESNQQAALALNGRAVEVLATYAAERDAALETALLEEEPKLQRSISLIAACAAIAPLLGLLGTVTGMITTFDVITLYGTGNPRLLSGGISVALVTTQLGLVVAVPLLLGHAVVSRVAQRRGSELESIRAAVAEEEGRS